MSSVRGLVLFTADHYAVTNVLDTAGYLRSALFIYEQSYSVIRQVLIVHIGIVVIKVNTREFCEYRSVRRLIESVCDGLCVLRRREDALFDFCTHSLRRI